MELFEEVVVVTDGRSCEEAYTVRSVLEFYRLRVRFERLVQRRQLDDFFAGRLGTSPYTVVIAHGADTDDGQAIRFVLVDNPGGDPKAAEGWEPVTVDLTARTIPHIVTDGSGTLITSSCGGGDSSLAEAFLRVGYDAYVGQARPYYSSDASLMFLTGLFYFLLAEDRDFDPRRYSLEEAVARAAALDTGWKFGTEHFRCYSRPSS
ncbi:MAG TPA: hypothetical protein VGR11_17075 [Solirubrobacteraceae bacterium]|nr:hypothetical protein [Solirubrobacteraceae bacterium]